MRNMWTGFVLSLILLLVAACGNNTSAPEQNNTQTNEQQGATSTQAESASNQETIELSYAFFAPANTFPAVQMKKWAEELEKRTNGKVKVKLFPGGTLLTAKNMFDGVTNKVADIGLTATSYEPGRFPLLSISDMPSGYPNAEVASKVVYDLLQEYPPDALKDFKLITAFATEPSYIQSKKPAGSLAELKGQRLRISGANLPVLEALGAAPVGMGQAEAVEALQTGVIEGNVSSREILKDLKLGEMVKYVVDYPLTITSFVAVMNKDTWNSLPPDVQKVIDELGPEMADFTGKYLDQYVQEVLQWSKDTHGLEVISLSPEEKAAWDQKILLLQDKAVEEGKAKGLPGDEYKMKLYELIKKYKQ